MPYQMRYDSACEFPNPVCIPDHGPEILWLDAVKLQHTLKYEVAKHTDMLCRLMIEEMKVLKSQSNLPLLSKDELMKELEAPRFDLMPLFEEELRVLRSNLKSRSELLQLSLSNSSAFTHIISEGGNYFSSVGSETDVFLHLKDSWKSKLLSKVPYSVVDSERERIFHDRIIKAFEWLHNQSRLDRLQGEQWRSHWVTHSFDQCPDMQARGMMKNIIAQMVQLNPAIDGKHFSLAANEARAASG